MRENEEGGSMKKWEVTRTSFGPEYCAWTVLEGDRQMCSSSTVRKPEIGINNWVCGEPEEVQARIELVAAAVNACKEINPENPIAAAAAVPQMFRLLLAIVADEQKICGKRLDPEQWLKKANEAVDQAMK